MVNSRILRFCWFLLGVVTLAFLCLTWGITVKGRIFTEPWIDRLSDLGNLFGFLTLFMMLLMTILGTRPRAIEKPFGLDRLIRLHKLIGPLVLLFLILHVGMKTLKYYNIVGGKAEDVGNFLLQFSPYSWDPSENGLVIARWAFIGLLVALIFAKGGQSVLPFKAWKPLHSLMYLVILTGFAHSLTVGNDVTVFPMSVGWLTLLSLWIIFTFHRIYYLINRSRYTKWLLEEVIEENQSIHTCIFRRAEGLGSFKDWYPGQFALFRYKSELWGWSEPHPFTISCIPQENKICCTVKGVGPFSKKLRTMPTGTAFLCEGPYGVFVPNLKSEKKLVFIAGGIGITPFLAIIRYIAQENLSNAVTLIWGNKTRADIIAYRELSSLIRSQETPDKLKIVHVIGQERITESMINETSEDGFLWEEGIVRSEILQKHVDPKGASFYLCGPPSMQKFVLGEIRRVFRIRPGRVKRELFFY